MEDGEDSNDHYCNVEMLNASPYNYYGSQIFVPVSPSSISDRGVTLYSNFPSTSTAADRNEIAAS